MDQYFPEVSDMIAENVVVSQDFDAMKRKPIHNWFVGYNQVILMK